MLSSMHSTLEHHCAGDAGLEPLTTQQQGSCMLLLRLLLRLGLLWLALCSCLTAEFVLLLAGQVQVHAGLWTWQHRIHCWLFSNR